MGAVIGGSVAVLVVGFVVVAEGIRSPWFRAFRLGRAFQRSDAVFHSAAVEMRQAAERQSEPAPSWQDW